jgi:hypothetical protein
MIGTRQAAEMLGIRPGTLLHAVWETRIPRPKIGPGGCYIWGDEEIAAASKILRHKDASGRHPLPANRRGAPPRVTFPIDN